MSKLDQPILCIQATKLFKSGQWTGFKQDQLDYYYQLLLRQSQFKIRSDLEKDPSYKQIIPQIILTYQNKYFLHQKVSANETRLNSLYPLFLGGHVEKFDLDQSDDIIQTALYRELAEEVELQAKIINKKFVGLIYLNDNPVNRCHLGLVYIFQLDSDQVHIQETDSSKEVGFVDLKFLQQYQLQLTYWSRLILPYLKNLATT
ncbi:hypothetical protein DRH14_01745 [Candidatus Shapirobacteria bacterium]|nr:MAG: hypothetical protein DRH14_01745 [Candidatus Shapirobacteria bacterium]